MVTSARQPRHHTDRLAYSITEACQLLGCGESFLRRQIVLGNLRGTKVGRRVFITPAAISAFLAGDLPAEKEAV